MRHVAAYDICSRMRYGNSSVQEAARDTTRCTLPNDSGGFIVVNKHGEFSMEFNTLGMFRGVCDVASQSSQVGIWEELISVNL